MPWCLSYTLPCPNGSPNAYGTASRTWTPPRSWHTGSVALDEPSDWHATVEDVATELLPLQT